MLGKKSYLGVVLAGGQSRRMGYDKALAHFGGTTLIDYVLCRLSRQLDDVVINTHRDDVIFSKKSLTLIRDECPFVGCGPLSGVYAAWRYITATKLCYEGVITVAVDTPFFPENYVAHLCEMARVHPRRVLMATNGDALHPTFALWPCNILTVLSEHLAKGDYAVLSFARRVGVEFVDFDPHKTNENDAFFNINTQQDLQLAQLIGRIR